MSQRKHTPGVVDLIKDPFGCAASVLIVTGVLLLAALLALLLRDYDGFDSLMEEVLR